MADTKVYLPRQHVKRGVASYRGKDVVIVDRDASQVTADDDAKAAAKKVVTASKPKADSSAGE